MVEQFERAHFFRRMSEASSIADCGASGKRIDAGVRARILRFQRGKIVVTG
jgi:hypothetical protein